MDMNALSARNVRPNRLTGVEVTPTSHEIALLSLAPEYGMPADLVINRDIAEFIIKELKAFLDPASRPSVDRN
jgi:hypothetical protein